MARTFARIGLGAAGLLAGLGAGLGTPLAAQALWLPASDPVGIARAGAGVAFGQSLEAASLNPALLVTLREDASAFVAAGMELQSSQATLQANQEVHFSSDRNRFLPSLGAAWKVRPDFYVGLKLDNPFMRHVQMPLEYSGRFDAESLQLTSKRVELQAAWAATPALSFGVSLGVTRVQYSFSNDVRIPVARSPQAPVTTGNPAIGMMELLLAQEGTKVLPSYALGFRWAINPRWTLGGAWQGPVTGTLGLQARMDSRNATYNGISGFGPADPTTPNYGPAAAGATTTAPGAGGLTLPGRLSLGLRQRLYQSFTWEADLRYVQGAAMRLPGYPTLTGPSGTVSGAGMPGEFHSGWGLSLAGEMTITKLLTARIGLAQDPGLRQDPTLEPTLGGSRTSSFSAGLGWKAFGGEFNFGWMVRQAEDREVKNLDGVWKAGGYTTTGTLVRVENMGHLWSVGFKKAF